jgi:hypothetical protein
MNLESLWQDIADEQRRSGNAGLSVRRIDPQCADDLFVGIRMPEGTRVLLLRLPATPRVSKNALLQSRGFVSHLACFEHDPGSCCNLVIEATAPSFNSVFGVLADSIVSHILARGCHETALAVFVASLQQWKRFFDAAGPEGLSEEKLLGLLAELQFLRDFAIRYTSSAITALGGWVGPDPLSKDFEYPGCAVEVKAASSREPVKAWINGERQLDDQGVEDLFLFVLLTERAAAGGTTVPELVEAIRTLLPEGSLARLKFEEKLIAYGYHDMYRARYEATRFILHGYRLFQVRAGFPRLTAMLPEGVGDISYTITLSACEPFRAQENALADRLHSVPQYDA